MSNHINRDDVYRQLFRAEVEAFIGGLAPTVNINEVINPFFLPRSTCHWLIDRMVSRKIIAEMKRREQLRKQAMVDREIEIIERSVAAARQKIKDDENRLEKALTGVQINVDVPEFTADQSLREYLPHRVKFLALQLAALNAKDDAGDFDPSNKEEMRRLDRAWGVANHVGTNIRKVLLKQLDETVNDWNYQGLYEDYKAAFGVLEPVWAEFCVRKRMWINTPQY